MLVNWCVVFNVPSTARSFRDGAPIYCPLRRTWSSVFTPSPPGIEPQVVAWQSITQPLRHASSTHTNRSKHSSTIISCNNIQREAKGGYLTPNYCEPGVSDTRFQNATFLRNNFTATEACRVGGKQTLFISIQKIKDTKMLLPNDNSDDECAVNHYSKTKLLRCFDVYRFVINETLLSDASINYAMKRDNHADSSHT